MALGVEDNAATREALVLLNHQVLEASNGQQALTIFEQRVSETVVMLAGSRWC